MTTARARWEQRLNRRLATADKAPAAPAPLASAYLRDELDALHRRGSALAASAEASPSPSLRTSWLLRLAIVNDRIAEVRQLLAEAP